MRPYSDVAIGACEGGYHRLTLRPFADCAQIERPVRDLLDLAVRSPQSNVSQPTRSLSGMTRGRFRACMRSTPIIAKTINPISNDI